MPRPANVMATIKATAKQIFTRGEDKKSTSLLDLPAEIWSKIGKLVIDDTKPVQPSYSTCEHFCTCKKWPPPQQPSITRVTRALREELLPYYYQTKVKMSVTLDHSATCDWLRIIGRENRKHIIGFELTSSPWGPLDATMLDLEWGLRAEVEKSDGIAQRSWHEVYSVKFL